MINKLKSIFLHSAGATVRHEEVFSNLEVVANENSLSDEFIQKWVAPFYMWGVDNDSFLANYSEIKSELDETIVDSLLSEFNWRPRIVGAYFSALKQYRSFEDTIGKLLLRSDVCYAGVGYTIALTSFNTESSVNYLKQYLDYYLTKKDLWFDQCDVMAAVKYLDSVNDTENFEDRLPAWNKFASNKPNWDLESKVEWFSKTMEQIKKIANQSLDLTVKTPVDPVSVLRTAGQA